MFWKRPSVHILLSVLAALCLSGGVFLFRTTAPSADAVATTFPATMPETAVTYQTVPADTFPEAATDQSGATGQAAGASALPESPSLRPYLAVALVFLGSALSILYLLTGKAPKPRLGADACLILLGLSVPALWFSLSLAAMAQLPLTSLLFWLCLLCSGELVCWVQQRCPLTWSNAHRAGMAAGQRGYALIQCLWFAGSLALGILILALRQGVLLPLGLALLASCLLSLLSLRRLGQDLDALTGQISAISQGSAPALRGLTVFEESQRQLSSLHTAQEAAIQAAVTSERFKVELISNVSHDLRTPLTAILGYGELLEKEALPEQARAQLQRLNGKTAYMKDLVDSLFELTKVSSGADRANLERIDLIRLLEQTLGLFHDLLEDAGLQVRRHYCAERLPIVTDGARMHQVFANLLGNAVKYAPPGSRVHLFAEAADGQVTVRLTNIASYEMDFRPEDILQRFARGDKARSTPGSGLGLAIAQTYTESVGGHFRVAIDGEQFSAIVTLPERNS